MVSLDGHRWFMYDPAVIRLALITTLLLSSAPAAALPDTVYVMRHLQKAAGTDPGLTKIGSANAVRLAFWFKHDAPEAIYVTQFRRSVETARPLSRRLKVRTTSYDANATAAMIAKVQASKGPVLIVGHSNTVPQIIQALGGPRASGNLAESDFGRIWIVKSGRVRVVRLTDPQPRFPFR